MELSLFSYGTNLWIIEMIDVNPALTFRPTRNPRKKSKRSRLPDPHNSDTSWVLYICISSFKTRFAKILCTVTVDNILLARKRWNKNGW